MNARSLVALLAAAGLGLTGFVIGRTTASPEPVTGAKSEPKESPPRRQGPRSLVCAQVRTESEREDGGDACEQATLRAKWCEGQLAAREQERQIVRQAWPEGVETEQADQWTSTVESAIETCQLDVELELSDCSEYPCAAALRPRREGHGDLERERERLAESVRRCAPLRQAFGIEDAQVEEALDVFPLDARCGEEKREDFFVLMALDPKGPAFERWTAGYTSEQDQRDLMRWIFRRADDIAAQWPCQTQP